MSADAASQADPEEQPVSTAARRLVFAGLMLALALPAFDLLVLSTAGKDIVDDLGGSITWLFVPYQITLIGAMPLFGKLGDLYGRKVTFQVAVGLFVGGSVLAGTAVGPAVLVVARALQGVAAGGIVGQAQAVLADVVPPRERGRVAWIAPTVWTAAAMSGPFVGGFFVDNLSWRWIFFVTAPAGAVAFVLVGVAFRASIDRVDRRLDVSGAVLLVTAVSLVAVWLLMLGEGHEPASPTMVAIALGAVLASVMLVRCERRAPEPVFPAALLRDRIIAVCTATTFFIGAANFGMAVFLPLFLRVVTGISATRAGLALLPVSIGITLSSTIVGRIVTRTGRYRWFPLAGTAVFTAGIFQLSTLGPDSSGPEVWLGTFLAGTGSGMASPVIVLAMQNSVSHRDVGVVSSLAMFSRTLGQAIGPAMGGALMAVRFETHLGRLVAEPAELDPARLRTETSRIEQLAEPVRTEVIEAFRLAVNDSFRLAALCALAGVLVATLMRARPLRRSIDLEEPEPASPELPAH